MSSKTMDSTTNKYKARGSKIVYNPGLGEDLVREESDEDELMPSIS